MRTPTLIGGAALTISYSCLLYPFSHALHFFTFPAVPNCVEVPKTQELRILKSFVLAGLGRCVIMQSVVTPDLIQVRSN